ncbi:MAG: tetratricopeptide repeat protein, partial [Holophagales bacterium]|nr:tetratricopeptide repeat protein [Holophagales bacterium]
EQALGLDGGSPRLVLRLAVYELRRGRLDQALDLYDVVLDEDPSHLDARLQKGAVLARVGRREEARQLLVPSLAEHPEHPRALVSNAVYLDLPAGDLATAAARLDRALEHDPFQARAWRRLGDVRRLQGRPAEAEAVWRAGLERLGDDAALHARLARLLVARGDPASEHHLEEASRQASTAGSDLLLALAELYRVEGDESAAQGVYERVAANPGRAPGELNNRALALFGLGRTVEARTELERLLEAWPEHADARANLAVAAAELGDWPAAEQEARRVLSARPNLPEAWNTLGAAFEHRGEDELALDAYTRALEADPGYWRASLNRGLLARDGDPGEAARDLLRALEARGPSPEERARAHGRLADLYAGPLAEPVAAELHRSRFLELAGPDDPGHRAAEKGGRRDDE